MGGSTFGDGIQAHPRKFRGTMNASPAMLKRKELRESRGATHNKWFPELSKILHSTGYTFMRSSHIDSLNVGAADRQQPGRSSIAPEQRQTCSRATTDTSTAAIIFSISCASRTASSSHEWGMQNAVTPPGAGPAKWTRPALLQSAPSAWCSIP